MRLVEWKGDSVFLEHVGKEMRVVIFAFTPKNTSYNSQQALRPERGVV